LALDIAGFYSWEHLQLIEHMLCEAWQMTNRGHKLTGNRTSLDEYRQLFLGYVETAQDALARGYDNPGNYLVASFGVGKL
jgi:hypothetical protein